MSIHSRWLALAGVLVSLFATAYGSAAQLDQFYLKYNSGQSVQPIFEGWSKEPDGGYTMHFGYMNRNYVEDVVVPVGPENGFEPGSTRIGVGPLHGGAVCGRAEQSLKDRFPA